MLAAVLVAVALVLQTSVFHELAFNAVVPDLVLLVVVGAGLARGATFGMVTGFAAGLLVDLTPPADHFAGRWALALLVVGYLAGAIRQGRPTATLAVATAAAASFVGTSIYAMTGMLLHQTPAFGTVLTTILVGVAYDVVLAPLVLPLVLRAFDRVEPA